MLWQKSNLFSPSLLHHDFCHFLLREPVPRVILSLHILKISIYFAVLNSSKMPGKERLAAAADLIRSCISTESLDEYFAETGIAREDFKPLEALPFQGEIFAVDGSNAVVCDWSSASLNMVRAGYAVYRGRDWQRTAITFDDIFLADPIGYARQFDAHLQRFGLQGFSLRQTELERLSSYFRELAEYVALLEAVNEAQPEDLVLYDGGFTWKDRPLGSVLEEIFLLAEERGVDLVGISKSSSLSWGRDASRPLLPYTCNVGTLLFPGRPWFLGLDGKRVRAAVEGWEGEIFVAKLEGRSTRAFRVDLPFYLLDDVPSILGKVASHSCSAECLGYPHALFRAHRDLKVSLQERNFLRLELMDLLGSIGLEESQVRMLWQDYHEVMEMRP